MHPAFEIPRHVIDRLAPAERHVLRRLDHVAAKLTDRNLERGSGSQRWLLEQQRDVTALERTDVRHARGPGALQLQRQLEARFELRLREVANRQKPRRRPRQVGLSLELLFSFTFSGNPVIR